MPVSVSKIALDELRRRVGDERDPDALRDLAQLLAGDGRAGARALGRRCERMLERQAAERARMRSLLQFRDALRAEGAEFVAGVDEVGVGPLAGPVVAAAVILPEHFELPGLDDSKKLTRDARDGLAESIHEQAVGVALGAVSPPEIDERNIYHAALEAMRRAVEGLAERHRIDHLMVDARTVPGVRLPQTPLVKGDSRDASIAAASIVAKVHRDRLMVTYDSEYPGYGFGRHMGYGTAEHLAALDRLGACPIHRRSFAPVAEAVVARRAPPVMPR